VNRSVLVIGAGPAGLATAAELQRAGLRVRVLERGDAVGANWRARYDGLRLNTVRWLSQLPGYRMPRSYGQWVGRDDYVAYLDRFRSHHHIEVVTGTEARRLHRDGGVWTVATAKGDLEAAAVVVATGAFDQPVVPRWPGREEYDGTFHHVAAYRNPRGYEGQRVLVVGSGASGLEVALQLADGGAAQVDLSVRSGVHLFPRHIGPAPLTPHPLTRNLPTPALNAMGAAMRAALPGDWPHPLPRPAYGLGTGLALGVEAVVADGVVPALRAGRIGLVAAVAGLGRDGVHLTDGTTIRPDVVIAATGYRSGLRDLVAGLDVLDAAGGPVSGDGGRDPHSPGLAFVGFRAALTGRLPQMAHQARRAAITVRAALGS
jgi:putative flavoprotein involved in K+ transport